jgi:hypothetical protein
MTVHERWVEALPEHFGANAFDLLLGCGRTYDYCIANPAVGGNADFQLHKSGRHPFRNLQARQFFELWQLRSLATRILAQQVCDIDAITARKNL